MYLERSLPKRATQKVQGYQQDILSREGHQILRTRQDYEHLQRREDLHQKAQKAANSLFGRQKRMGQYETPFLLLCNKNTK